MEIAVILHNIRSLHNVGSIFRTADAAGAEKIYLTGITPAPVDRFGVLRPQFAKVSLGAENYLPYEKVFSAVALIKKLKKSGYRIFAVEQDRKAAPYYKINIGSLQSLRSSKNRKIALIFGNEVRGLPPSILKLAYKILEIPMRGAMVRQAYHPRHLRRGKESLNVSVAAGVVLFHLLYGSREK